MNRRYFPGIPIVAASAFVWALIASPASAQTIYMSVLSSRVHQWSRSDNPVIGLFFSSDRGATWQHHGWQEYIRTFQCVEGSDGTLWAACGNGVLRSTDGGEAWRVTTGWQVTEVLRIAVDPKHPERVYAATAYGLIASTDHGDTWEFRKNGITRPFTADVCVDRTNGGHLLMAAESGLFISDDAGMHWRPASLSEKDVRTVVQDPAADTVFWVGTGGHGVWRSGDGGLTWSPANSGIDNRTVYTIAIDSSTPHLMFAGTHGEGVYRSTNRGRSWQQCASGLTNPDVHSLAIVPGSPYLVFAGTLNGGLFRSTDKGLTWTFDGQPEAQVWGLTVGEGRRAHKK